MDSVLVKGANTAPTIIIDMDHGGFVPAIFSRNAPSQSSGDNVMAVPKNVRFHYQIFAGQAFHRITPAIHQRPQVLNNNRRKTTHHRTINQTEIRQRRKEKSPTGAVRLRKDSY